MGDVHAGAPAVQQHVATCFLDLPIHIQAAILHLLDTPTQKSLRSTCSYCVENLSSYMCPSISVSLAACKTPAHFVASLLAYPRTAARLKKLKLQWGHASDEFAAVGSGTQEPQAQALRSMDPGAHAVDQVWHLVHCLDEASANQKVQEMLAGVEELVLQGQLHLGYDIMDLVPKNPDHTKYGACSALAVRLFVACPHLGTLVEATSIHPALYVGIGMACNSWPSTSVEGSSSSGGPRNLHTQQLPPRAAQGGSHAATASQGGGGPHSLHTLQLPSTQWIPGEMNMNMLFMADGLEPTGLQHLRLGHLRSGSKRGSVDVSPLCQLTSLRSLQLACDERLVGLDAILSSCTQLTQLEVSHWWPHLVPLRVSRPSTSLQRIIVSHSFSLASLPSLLDATTTSLREICLMREVIWGGAGNGLNEPLPPASAARLSDISFTWGTPSVGMTIDALNRGLILPCAKALIKLQPYTNLTLAHGLQRLHLESVGFGPGDMSALCELLPNIRVASFDSCVLRGSSVVLEAVRGWEGLQMCTFLGEEEDNFGFSNEPGSSTLEEDMRAVKQVLQARRARKMLTLAYCIYESDDGLGSDGVGESELVDPPSLEPLPRTIRGQVQPLLEGCAHVTWRISVERD